ncbi:MAG: 4'-phosphopantetheinyl transferase [Phototrophicales bacterium]|nr:MAG: 4'-phosphopantetheinyl transferase [Phototrophicales bacterium]
MLRHFLLPNINHQKIFVFWWRVSRWSAYQQAFASVLSSDETHRANRFLSEAIQTRFIVARGMMRHILSYYTKQQPQTLIFRYGIRGKPILDNVPFAFNLSHSDDVVMLAMAQAPTIGVDVEQIVPMVEMRRVAADYFSMNEQIALFALPTHEQLPAFYRCWTRKEAYIKARGDGFALPLDQFDVTLIADDHPRLLRTMDDDHPDNWRFFHLDSIDGYIGALCVPEGDWMLEMQEIISSS